MSAVTKVAGGTVALGGTTGTVGYGVYDHSTYTLEYLLNQEEPKPKFVEESSSNKDSQFKALIRSYRSVADSKKTFEDSTLDLGNASEDPIDKNIEALFNKCNGLRKTWVRFGDFEELKSKVKNWCTEITDVKDALKREGKTVLEGEDAKFSSVFGSKKENTDFKNFLGKGSESLDASTHLTDYKSKCQEALAKKPQDNDYSTSLDNARKYCVALSN